jgi:biopolymer transport protein ExbD
MLTASFAMQKSLQVPKPERAGPSAAPRTVAEFVENPDYVVVRVDANNTFYVNAGAFAEEIEAPTEPELMVKLRQARQGDGRGNIPTKMLVVAHGDALHDRVVSAIDAGNDVGMEEVQLVTVEDE